jgi:2-keto-3-deoxy-L-rhamnonate aldolase RhmA
MDPFRDRLRNGAPLLGAFYKTPSPIIGEVFGRSGLDFVCIDGEHCPFGRLEIDTCVMALRSVNMPCIVRVPTAAPEHILAALDSGANGILVPHVTTAKQAAAIAHAARHAPGGRGYAGSTRAGGYSGKSIAQHLSDSAATTTVLVQIEDADALDHVEKIAQVDGVDGVFVGRMDLTVSLGCSCADDPKVVEVVHKICADARKHNRAVGMYTPSIAEVPAWSAIGASFYILSSDHSLLLAGARALRADFDARIKRDK